MVRANRYFVDRLGFRVCWLSNYFPALRKLSLIVMCAVMSSLGSVGNGSVYRQA